jgi:glycosyltransferase involved in cell wall biosynthesis
MRILHLATNDIAGGAARAAYRLHTGMRRLGQDSVMFVMNRTSDDTSVIRFVPPMDFTTRVRRRLRSERITRNAAAYTGSRIKGHPFSEDRSPYGGTVMKQVPPCDVIHLHWIANFVDYQDFWRSRPLHTPVVWRLADMNPFTGGCHFDHGCGKYANGCGACPQLGSSNPLDLSHQIWRRKQAALAAVDPDMFHIVALTRSAAEDVRRSGLFGRFPVSVIPNGVDTDTFAPRDKAAARQELGLPRAARIVLFCAHWVEDRRKGFDLLDQALSGLDEVQDLFLVTVGNGTPRVQARIPHAHLGHVNDDQLLSRVYSAADVFVCPSVQEMFAKTPLEAMACGTPVIGFEGVGGVSEVVRQRVTGNLVGQADVNALRNAIRDLLEDSQGRACMSAACRQLVLQEFAVDMQVKRYLTLYQGLLDHAASRHTRANAKLNYAVSVRE